MANQNENISLWDKTSIFFNRFYIYLNWLVLIAALIGFYYAIKKPNLEGIEPDKKLEILYSHNIDSLTVICGISVFLLFISAFYSTFLIRKNVNVPKLESELKEKNLQLKLASSNLQRVSSINHDIFHSSRDLIVEMNNVSTEIFNSLSEIERDNEKIIFQKIIDKNYDKELDVKFNDYLNHLLSNIKTLFDILTGDSTAVSVKYFDYKTDEKGVIIQRNVRTFRRDSSSRRRRSLVDKNTPVYAVESNTAFKEIMESRKRSFFFSNDLEGLGKMYLNSNPEWNELYNACMVSGLVAIANNEVPDYNMIGALCIDNFEGNFNEYDKHDFLASISDVLASVIHQHTELQEEIRKINNKLKSNTNADN